MSIQAVSPIQNVQSALMSFPMNATDGQSTARVMAVSSLHRKAPGEIVFAQGDEQDNIYEVVRGMICLYKLLPDGRRQVTGFLSTGQLLPASGIDGICAVTAEAVTDVTVCRYPRPAFERLIDEVPGFARRLLAMTSNELQAAQDQMLLLGRKVAAEKVASFLLLMAERQGVEVGTGSVDVPMTRADIADYLGLTVETVSRTFTRLKRDRLIDLPTPNLVRVRDPERLEELAAGDSGPDF
jgi:CRP/FNR family transcriptional regulator